MFALAAEVTGSVGLAGSANIGEQIAMFEAIHGSAPDIAGKGIANPSGLLQGAIMMLVHIGRNKAAENIHNALLKTLEDGIHTADIFNPNSSKSKVSTEEFTSAIIARLGQKPTVLKAVTYPEFSGHFVPKFTRSNQLKELVGIDVFVQHSGGADILAEKLIAANKNQKLTLQMISNRGVKVWPNGFEETFLTDLFRCRFVHNDKKMSKNEIINLLKDCEDNKLDFVKTEHLYYYYGEPGF
jgi:isocitrate dehydrogenase